MDLEVQGDKKLEAKHGYIYEFDDGKNPKTRYVLVVSADSRARDKLVSILMFNDVNRGRDIVQVRNKIFEEGVKYLHCGMITYTSREYLAREVCKLADDKMEKVEEVIGRELDIMCNAKTEAAFYKNAYEELLNKCLDNRSTED